MDASRQCSFRCDFGTVSCWTVIGSTTLQCLEQGCLPAAAFSLCMQAAAVTCEGEPWQYGIGCCLSIIIPWQHSGHLPLGGWWHGMWTVMLAEELKTQAWRIHCRLGLYARSATHSRHGVGVAQRPCMAHFVTTFQQGVHVLCWAAFRSWTLGLALHASS